MQWKNVKMLCINIKVQSETKHFLSENVFKLLRPLIEKHSSSQCLYFLFLRQKKIYIYMFPLSSHEGETELPNMSVKGNVNHFLLDLKKKSKEKHSHNITLCIHPSIYASIHILHPTTSGLRLEPCFRPSQVKSGP